MPKLDKKTVVASNEAETPNTNKTDLTKFVKGQRLTLPEFELDIDIELMRYEAQKWVDSSNQLITEHGLTYRRTDKRVTSIEEHIYNKRTNPNGIITLTKPQARYRSAFKALEALIIARNRVIKAFENAKS